MRNPTYDYSNVNFSEESERDQKVFAHAIAEGKDEGTVVEHEIDPDRDWAKRPVQEDPAEQELDQFAKMMAGHELQQWDEAQKGTINRLEKGLKVHPWGHDGYFILEDGVIRFVAKD